MKPILLIALLLAGVQCACKRDGGSPASTAPTPENSVAAFLKNAERQTETDEQRREVQRALHDMLDKPPSELRQIRYADYTGQMNKWSITEVVSHYFVPNPPMALDETRFYQDVQAPAARAAIQHQLDDVSHALQ